MRRGIRLESECIGDGCEASRGDTVTIAYELRLNHGERVQSQDSCSFTLGKRQVIAGLEYGVEGMRVGGRRQFRASPQLCYRDAGVPGVIPPDAVLEFDVRLISVAKQS